MQVVHHLLVEVVPAWQLLLVQRLEHPGADQRGDQGSVEHDQVVAGAAGEQFGLYRFVAVEGVVDDLDAGGLLEVGQGGFADVVGPVVQPQRVTAVHLCRLGQAGARRQQQTANHLQYLAHGNSIV
ncbi:hypothetical protein D3C76_1410680 [compost metagenome]